jgi:hypothetical protein
MNLFNIMESPSRLILVETKYNAMELSGWDILKCL